MNILKRENWWIWLLLLIFSGGSYNIALGALTGVFDKNAWYANWKIWIIGIACLIFPVIIMGIIFIVQISVKTAEKLNVPGNNIYTSIYSWIICLIVPVIGWILLIVMLIYINVWPIIMLERGEGEKHIKNF